MTTIETKLKVAILKKYPKGTRFISPLFPTQIVVSTGELAGVGFDKNFVGFANVWLEDGTNVPVLMNGKFAEIIKDKK